MTQVVLGLDLGTSEAKAILVGLDGTLVGLGRAPIRTELGQDGRAEQDPRDWWRACASAVRAIEPAGEGDGERPDIVAIGIVGQGPTLAVVDEDARPLRFAITWQDRRIGGGGFGLLPKIEWLAREDPDAAAEARWLLGSWDALGLWLTGEAGQTLQAHESAFAPEALEAAGVRPSQVPPPLPFGQPLGWLRAEAAGALGLRPGIPVMAGVNDGTGSMLGAGLRLPGDAVDTGGTSGGIGIYTDRPVEVPGLFVAPAPLPGRWVVGGAMAATGAAVDWFRAVSGAGWSTDELVAAAAAVPAGANGLVFLPYLAGRAGAGVRRAGARRVRRADAGPWACGPRPGGARGGRVLPASRRRAAGRGGRPAARAPARRPAEPRRHLGADQGGRPGRPRGDPRRSRARRCSARRSSRRRAAGSHPDLEAAVTAMTTVDRRIEPDPSVRAVYDARFAVYRSLYPALAPAMHALGE